MSNVNLLKMTDMKQIEMIIKKHKCGWFRHTPRKDFSGILWMVSEKKAKTLRDVETNCGKCKKPDLIGNNWPSQDFGGELALLMAYVSVGIKEIKKKKRLLNTSLPLFTFLFPFAFVFSRSLLPDFLQCLTPDKKLRDSSLRFF